MFEVKHTPGPWEVGAPPEKIITGYRDERGNMTDDNYTKNGLAKVVATIKNPSWQHIDEFYANGRLIAAAPYLLAALQAAASSAGFQYMMAETRNQIDAAISKATGGAS